MEIISNTYLPKCDIASRRKLILICKAFNVQLLLNGKKQAEIPIYKLKSLALVKILSRSL